MSSKKTTTTTNGGSQIFLSTDAQDAIAEIQFRMASQSPSAMQKYGGRGGKSLVIEELKRARKTETDIANDKKGVAWKVRIAIRLRKETTVKNPWIAQRLNMGNPNYVSLLVNR